MKWFNFFSDFRPNAPIAILYFSQVTGSFALGMLVFSIFSLSTSAFEVPTGVFSDKIGRKKTMVLGAFISALSLVITAIGGSFWFLAFGAVMGGLAQALFSGNNDALVYDSLAEIKKEHFFHEHIGKINALFQAGLGTSALLAALLADFSFSFIYWIAVIPQAISLCISFAIKEPKVHKKDGEGNVYVHLKEALKKFKENSKLRHLSLSSILRFGMGEVGHQFIPAFVSTVWPVWAIGIARSMDHFFGFIGFHYAGNVINRFSSFKVLITGQILSALLIGGAVAIPGVWSPILIALTSISFGFTLVALDALMQREFSNEQRATMGSLNALFGSIFFGVFAFAFGLIADQLGTAQPLLITQILSLFIVYLYVRMFKRHQKETLLIRG